jgi:hypothetical protein
MTVSEDGYKRGMIFYMTKQRSPQAAWMRGVTRRRGGPALGKRAGVTTNLTAKAIAEHDRAARRVVLPSRTYSTPQGAYA